MIERMTRFPQLVIGTYGATHRIGANTFRRWWGEIEAWAERLGLAPCEVSGSFGTKPKGLINYNAYDLSRHRKRFEKEVDSGNVNSLSLTRLCDKWVYRSEDWEFDASLALKSARGTMFDLGVRVDRLRGDDGATPPALSMEAFRRGTGFIQCLYGFAVIMPKTFLAAGYTLGLGGGDMPDELVFDASVWRSGASAQCGMILRNVHGLNLLSREHLSIPAGDRTLREWIDGASYRGRLIPFTDDLYLWTFQEGSDQEAFLHWGYPPVVRVREELRKFRLFPWQDDLDEDLRMSNPDYRAP
jgi:hypothetical protein